jgi:hypothetical protein
VSSDFTVALLTVKSAKNCCGHGNARETTVQFYTEQLRGNWNWNWKCCAMRTDEKYKVPAILSYKVLIEELEIAFMVSEFPVSMEPENSLMLFPRPFVKRLQ